LVVLAGDRSILLQRAERNKRFVRAYQTARANWRDGLPAEFPIGNLLVEEICERTDRRRRLKRSSNICLVMA
jgi:hypothetical protein